MELERYRMVKYNYNIYKIDKNKFDSQGQVDVLPNVQIGGKMYKIIRAP